MAAAAKSLQSCLTLYDPIDGSPPGSTVPGILQARTLEWVAISLSNFMAAFTQILLTMRTSTLKELGSTTTPDRVESTKNLTCFRYDGGQRHKVVTIIHSDCKDSMNQV